MSVVGRWARGTAVAVGLAVIAIPAVPTPAAATETWADRAAKYAPQLRFHSGEQFWPAKVSWIADRSRLRFSKADWFDAEIAGQGSVNEARLGGSTGSSPYTYTYNNITYRSSDCTRPYTSLSSTPHCADPYGRDRSTLARQEGFFLDIDDSAHPGQTDFNTGTVPVYYQHGTLASGGYYLTFWFSYAYDKFTWLGPDQQHEGDWEKISMRLDANYVPQTVAWSYHNCAPIKLSWANTPKVYTTHPVSYVGEGSHADYPSTDVPTLCDISTKDNVNNTGKRWNTWNYVVDTNNAGWYGFGGAWGEVASPDNTYASDYTGPMGPSPYKDPSPWDETAY
jgi:hypothetical protein